MKELPINPAPPVTTIMPASPLTLFLIKTL